jgi:phosphoserine phosphatase RsbU/P
MKRLVEKVLADRRSQRRMWDSTSRGSRLLLLAGVFFLFSAIGLTTDVTSLGQARLLTLAFITLFGGLMAAAWVVIIIRYTAWLPLLILIQVVATFGLSRLPPGPAIIPPGPAAEALKHRLLLNTLGTVACISLSYTFFAIFVIRSGRHFVQLDTELRLARDIHRTLSPEIKTTIGAYEFFGASSPSGDVGGDLVDVVPHEGEPGWTAYLVDVSGHGVPSGVLMGMVKSAVRTALTRPEPLPAMLRGLNTVLLDLSQPQMFATFAAMRPAGENRLSFTLAGHLPILCWRAATGTIEELTVSQVPLGILPDRVYSAAETDCAPGDLFLLLTDGFTEVFDRADVEFGLEGVRTVLTAKTRAPLAAIEGALVEASRAHGPQLDDQSLILIRRQ